MSVNPTRPKGPPLNALRAFEAAARLGGFAAAAQELSVTPGAVAQHIKALEAWAGAPLFERRSQGVRLTALGRDAAEDLGAAFDALGVAQRRLKGRSGRRAVAIAALPSVAQLWLGPRLARIRAALPDCTLSVTALETPPNLDRELFDLSLFIRRPAGRPGETILAEDVVFPVCAPSLAVRLRTVSDLASETLLFDASWKEDWPLWLKRAGERGVDGGVGSVFSLYSMALAEARAGAGVLIGHQALVEPDLAAGALVRPFGIEARTGLSLVLERPESAGATPWLDRIIHLLSEPDEAAAGQASASA